MPAAAAAGAHLFPAMPGPAAEGGKVPFHHAKEEVRAGVEGSEGDGGQERPDARWQQQNIVWRNVVLMSLLHLGAVYSLVLIPRAKPLTLLWGKSQPLPGAPGTAAALARGRGSQLDEAVRASALPPAPPARSGPAGLQLSGLCDGQYFLPVFPTSASPAGSQSRRICRLPDGGREGPRVLRRHCCAQRRAKGDARHWLSPTSRVGRRAG
ncbi:Stearoyl-CoA desaturase 5 [Galemys pyrenaicus]|uniref:Stearoyl-CoA desaturase 5 n=1 Tax=Galemys pyrenaicus TaxID=202257 RepID=A0A8J6A4E5_GALPY|nr:Stearoyl-CoA desaturase 5 [Galemys pyrenaicus]